MENCIIGPVYFSLFVFLFYFLCYIVGPCWLSILNIAVYTTPSQYFSLFLKFLAKYLWYYLKKGNVFKLWFL